MTIGELKKLADKFDYEVETNNVETKIMRYGTYFDNVIEISECKEKTVDFCLDCYIDLEFLKAVILYVETPLNKRKPKKFIVPLPNLRTKDFQQWYLTNSGSRWFGCQRNETLKQVWRLDELDLIPKEYLQFAVEVKYE